jgi:4-diphosphocytidyl-2-C-methyl-D-erythritol kinase
MVGDSMSRKLRAVTRAKVNLSLEVLRRRRDGYHEIETIFQTVDLSDELEIELTDDASVTLTCSDPSIPVDESNLCDRAVAAMRQYAGKSLGARIHIQKYIPAGSGLGGGSSNAAGVLLAINRMLGLNLPISSLESAAIGLGSDVPFMLQGGTMLGRGRGEILTRLEPLTKGVFLIVKPPVSISTAWAYNAVNFTLTKRRAPINLININAVLGRFPDTTLSFRNALEDVVCPAHPVISSALDELLSAQPRFASMSGSGSALYAIFDGEAEAVDLAERFSVKGFFSFLARPAKRAVDLIEN